MAVYETFRLCEWACVILFTGGAAFFALLCFYIHSAHAYEPDGRRGRCDGYSLEARGQLLRKPS